eukprot:TRINITY_DN27716_c0_g1_i1.p1 TRINITY_DN27716_c0_g1~~TRINITY_DN27716_c0_g1_i1.p1  ORF type:complete len:108 (+),score=28.48 TRINITY_DN27716_c0_g1_i1:58-381(+)
MVSTYYYYTNAKQAKVIAKEKKIPAEPGILGKGVYLCTAGPDDKPMETLKTMYDEEHRIPFKDRTDFFALPKDAVSCKRKKKGVYVQTTDIDLEGVDFKQGHCDDAA